MFTRWHMAALQTNVLVFATCISILLWLTRPPPPLHINYPRIITDKLGVWEVSKVKGRPQCPCVCRWSPAVVFSCNIFERCQWSVGKCVCFLLQSHVTSCLTKLTHKWCKRLFTVIMENRSSIYSPEYKSDKRSTFRKGVLIFKLMDKAR